jgi:exonuclease SbcC
MNLPAQQLLHEEQRLTINKLTLSNFKGLKSFTLDAQVGQDIDVYGDNATGKTTLYDAFLWLLFDKDSSNRKTFQVKTLDATGEALHGLEHTVEASLLINGRPVTLKKTLTEKWTKKRGEAQKVFTGHQTEFWINEVPAKAGEYSRFIDSLISEDLFRLITNPLYFSTMLSWQDRRNILMQITGNISDADVIASNADLHELAVILGDRSVDDCRKIIAQQIKKLNEDLAKVPVRIDELTNTLAGGDVDYSVIEADLSKAKAELADLERQMLSASAITEAYREKQTKATQLAWDLGKRRSAILEQANAERIELGGELSKLQSKLGSTKVDIQVLESKIATATESAKADRGKADTLRAAWEQVSGAAFTPPAGDDVICPTCGQDLPSDQLQSKIDAMLDKFNTQKKQRLEQITAEGRRLVSNATETEKQISDMAETLQTKQHEAVILESDIEAIQTVLEMPTEKVDVEADPEYQAIQAKITALQVELTQPVEDASSDLIAQKQELTKDIEQMLSILNNRDVREKTLARIEDLKKEERSLAKKIAEMEKHRFLTEQFIKTKVSLMEDAINSRFQAVRFKLFDVQINEGIKECCEAMVNTNGAWVPYSDVNNAAKINSGLDIINTLSSHYGVSAPIFIDNREAVVDLFPVNAQTISLIVSGQDKTLRVEV